MNDKMETVSKLLSKLFASYPQAQPTNEALEAYLEAVSDYGADDLKSAVHAFLSGSAPGVANASFAPSAPMIGAEVRRQMNMRLDSEQRERMRRPQLPPPDIPKSEESKARVKELTERLAARWSVGFEAEE